MKKLILLGILILSAIAAYWLFAGPRPVPQEKTDAIRQFLMQTVAESLKQDYRSHGIPITAQVTDLTLDRITKKETDQDIAYYAVGRVTYIIRGPKTWRDREGNLVQLEPGQAITHWFSCGILEDRYLGMFLRDDRNRLQFYADDPMQQ